MSTPGDLLSSTKLDGLPHTLPGRVRGRRRRTRLGTPALLRVLEPRLLARTRLQRLMRLRRATLLDKLLARREPLGRPRARVPRLARRVAVHHVHALERQLRALVQEEVHDHRARQVARGEHEPVPVPDRARDERREEREEEVPQPVARRRERALARARARRERLADEDPDAAVEDGE